MIDPVALVIALAFGAGMVGHVERASHKRMAKHTHTRSRSRGRAGQLVNMAIVEEAARPRSRRSSPRVAHMSSQFGFEDGDGTIHATDDLDLNDWL